MRNINYFIPFVILLIFISLPSYGQYTASMDTVECMHVVGLAIDNNIPVDGVTVKLFKGNEEMECEEVSSVAKHDHHFSFDLLGNQYYTVQISKEGYVPRSVGISTEVPKNFVISETNPKTVFEFEVDLFKLKKGADDYYTDFPIALVRYEPKKKKFERSESYTYKLKRNMGDIAEPSTVTSPNLPKKK